METLRNVRQVQKIDKKELKVVIARGIHLFPFRTEKLSLVTPMVLRNSGRVGSRRFRERMKAGSTIVEPAFFFLDLDKTISQVVIQVTSENIVHVVVEIHLAVDHM